MERDVRPPSLYLLNVHFNSHAHVERDIYAISINELMMNFNSHAHVERDSIYIDSLKYGIDFNSHAHVERDAAFFSGGLPVNISTHTLTWSVTPSPSLLFISLQFQLTRSRGA